MPLLLGLLPKYSLCYKFLEYYFFWCIRTCLVLHISLRNTRVNILYMLFLCPLTFQFQLLSASVYRQCSQRGMMGFQLYVVCVQPWTLRSAAIFPRVLAVSHHHCLSLCVCCSGSAPTGPSSLPNWSNSTLQVEASPQSCRAASQLFLQFPFSGNCFSLFLMVSIHCNSSLNSVCFPLNQMCFSDQPEKTYVLFS